MNNDNSVYVAVPESCNDTKKLILASCNCPLNLKEIAEKEPKPTSRFGLGDVVNFLHKGRVMEGTIASVCIFQHCFASRINTSVTYWICPIGYFSESQVFASKEELLKSL